MSKQLIVRLDDDLKDRMQRLAKSEGKNASQVVRELVQEYVADRDPAGAIEELWTRIGDRLTDRGIRLEDVETAIDDVRTSHR